ncbi:recombinase family protein [Marinisporobacter balticus]|uniref:DNA invertase Pin-like site-specific DNA recombinase n=1 Tax=Marinisporobacter balticus TaxID=2018667 RepID=A0A4R2KX49_9FIRM|nr:recombinase family protein [Marinisporobacter balticus]TCO79151.1 DNA invertase Pin-like site-specific DNA recombinase [Marinisporobacter balticus]
MERVCMYLRKSRADEDAEKRGEGETLSKHRKALLKLATHTGLNIVKIREEIVSGESLMHRPEMLELLKEVEAKKYDAVLCMDIDRLGRGNMQEQGLILETFKKANTKIITSRKIYDLDDEFDEEYSEFEAFMARKELKIINRRLQSGRIRSIEEGNYISPLPPYGYEIHYTDKHRTLTPHPEQADIVKMIFDLYTEHGLGCNKIANKLNELGHKTYAGKDWSGSSTLTIIKNPVYAGKITWKKKEIKKSSDPNKVKDTRTRSKDDWIIANGKHEALISMEIFQRAQEILQNKYHVPYQLEKRITNPLAGLIRCNNCNASMILRPYKTKDSQIMCYSNCGNKSSKLKYIEARLIDGLSQWLEQYKAQWNSEKQSKKNVDTSSSIHKKVLEHLEKEIVELEKQNGNLHDLLERGIYDIDTYLERSQNLADRIESTKLTIKKAKVDLVQEIKREKVQHDIIPKIEKVLDTYSRTDDPAKKNTLLKSVLAYAVYRKEKDQRNDQFTLILYPKLPQ